MKIKIPIKFITILFSILLSFIMIKSITVITILHKGETTMKYDVILFDADETLFDFKKSEREAFKNAIDYDESYHLQIYQEINTAIWKEFEEGLITQAKLKIERFERLATRLGVTFDAQAFSTSYMKHLADASFLYEGALEFIDSLSKVCTLSIITNGLTDVQTKRIGQSIIAPYFKDIVISEAVKVSKPNPKIFELALNNINHQDKTTVLMVGDSLTSDIQGGINFGIDTCWYNPNKKENKSDLSPTYEVADFEQLKAIIFAE